MRRLSWLVPTLYIVFLLLPIYWLVSMSFKTTNEILGSFTLWPNRFTLENYYKIFTDPTWYNGYRNSVIYVVINTVISVTVALPAAYAFSRFRFLGDKHLFFWLLTNRMAPAAVFALPFFQLYSAIGLFDTHIAVALAHCLFNIPLAVWILEGFMSSVPKQLDETAYLDGYGFWRFFLRIFLPTIAAGIGVAAFFCFMFSWVELLLAKTLDLGRRKADRGHDDPDRQQLGLRARIARGGGNADHHSGCDRDLFRAELHRQGLRARAGVSGRGRTKDERNVELLVDGLDVRDRGILLLHRLPAGRHDGLGAVLAGRGAQARGPRHRNDPRRPALHLPLGRRLHPPGLARPPGPAIVGRDGRDARFRGGGLAVGMTLPRHGAPSIDWSAPGELHHTGPGGPRQTWRVVQVPPPPAR